MSRRRYPIDPAAPWACWEAVVSEGLGLKQREGRLWFGIARHASWRNGHWEAFPSRRLMARYIGHDFDTAPGVARREVAKCLASLHEIGLILRVQRFDKRGRQTSSMILLPTLPAPGTVVEQPNGQGVLFVSEPAETAPETIPATIPQGGRVCHSHTGEGVPLAHPQFLEDKIEDKQARALPTAASPEPVGTISNACLHEDHSEEPTEPVRLPGGETNWNEEIGVFLAALPQQLRPAPTNKLKLLVAEALDRDWDANGLADYAAANSGPTAGPGWVVSLLEQHPAPWRDDPPPYALPPLCGSCDNRWIPNDDGTVARCPNCHPAAVGAG